MVTKEEYKQVQITFMQGFDHVRSFPYICLPIESIHLYNYKICGYLFIS